LSDFSQNVMNVSCPNYEKKCQEGIAYDHNTLKMSKRENKEEQHSQKNENNRNLNVRLRANKVESTAVQV